MGACMSSESSEELEKKKRSRAIDAKLEEDSKRVRKECKILLLGKEVTLTFLELLANMYKAPEKAASPQLSSR